MILASWQYGDVQTFFHEFGHLMHRILGGQQPWAGISGITMEVGFRRGAVADARGVDREPAGARHLCQGLQIRASPSRPIWYYA